MLRVDESYYNNGKTSHKRWFKNNLLHREDGPAYIRYYNTGIKSQMIWVKFTERHRLDGPAIINFNEDGSVLSELYFIDDIRYPFTEWLKKIKMPKEKKVELKLKYTEKKI